MSQALHTLIRFTWRASRNAVCAVPGGAGLLFPTAKLAQAFGRADAEYALNVYQHHAVQLQSAGFEEASAVLEVGPGRNLGSALLWWCRTVAEGRAGGTVMLWDVHPNVDPNVGGFWPTLADELIRLAESDVKAAATIFPAQRTVLSEVAAGRQPTIEYLVCPMAELEQRFGQSRFDLVISQAALEHIWRIAEFWPLIVKLTAPAGWHSHRIDLADHGRRESNYIEMLEWPPWAWWLTMRFVPGAINRWRVGEHLAAAERCGINILSARRELRDALPVPRRRIAKRYCELDEDELRTTAVDIVGRCGEAACAC